MRQGHGPQGQEERRVSPQLCLPSAPWDPSRASWQNLSFNSVSLLSSSLTFGVWGWLGVTPTWMPSLCTTSCGFPGHMSASGLCNLALVGLENPSGRAGARVSTSSPLGQPPSGCSCVYWRTGNRQGPGWEGVEHSRNSHGSVMSGGKASAPGPGSVSIPQWAGYPSFRSLQCRLWAVWPLPGL